MGGSSSLSPTLSPVLTLATTGAAYRPSSEMRGFDSLNALDSNSKGETTIAMDDQTLTLSCVSRPSLPPSGT
jgi:hypothetical protein